MLILHINFSLKSIYLIIKFSIEETISKIKNIPKNDIETIL